jgi:hypothetical protein
LDLFQYFWPVSQQEFQSMQAAIEVKLASTKIFSYQEIEQLSQYLDRNPRLSAFKDLNSAVFLTLNDYTKHWVSEIIHMCRSRHITEFVIFKDPSMPPYLCSYPAQQKGFKRPPPMS